MIAPDVMSSVSRGVFSLSMTAQRVEPRRNHRRHCDRCNSTIEDGYTWPALGVPILLCIECTRDIEESVRSYGESGEAARRRLLDRLRRIDA